MMNCCNKKILIFLVALSFSGGAFAKSIMPSSERQTKISEAEKLIQVAKPIDRGYFQGLVIPFLYVEPETTSSSTEPKFITDKDMLEYFVEKHLPRGRVYKSNKYYLVFDFGPRTEGEFFQVEFKGKTYNVKLEEIRTKSYVLKFKDETQEIKFSDVASKRQKKTPALSRF